MKYLSVVIPCYNELENLEKGVLEEVANYLSHQEFEWEVVISDDGSNDGSFEFVEGYIKKKRDFVHVKNVKGGKAFALKAGVERARGEYILSTDMDQSTPINEFDKFKDSLAEGFDIVIGSRGFRRENYPLLRKVGSPIFLLLRRMMILPTIRDTQCGFKCFRKKSIKKVFPKLEVFKRERGVGWRVGAWDVELLYVAQKMGMRINEVTVNWRDVDVSTSKERRYVQESLEMLREVIIVRKNDFEKKYD